MGEFTEEGATGKAPAPNAPVLNNNAKGTSKPKDVNSIIAPDEPMRSKDKFSSNVVDVKGVKAPKR